MNTLATEIEALDAQVAASEESAWSDYRAMLDRADAPEDGDAERMAKTLGIVGKTIDDMRADLAVIRSAQELEETIESVDVTANLKRFEDVNARREEVEEEKRKDAAKYQRANVELALAWRAAEQESKRRRDAEQDLTKLRNHNRRLFGLDERPAEAPEAGPAAMVLGVLER